MTMNPDQTRSTEDAAQQEAEQVKEKTRGAAEQVAGTAQQEASHVKDEAMAQARSLTDSALDEINSQASTQQKRLAEQSRTVTDDLQRLARGERAESDLVNQFISMAADRAQKFTTQLENKEPADLLKDVRRFAARRPGAFLAIAAGVGLAAGRFTRGLSDKDDDVPRPPTSQTSQTTPTPARNVTPAPPVTPDPVDRLADTYPGAAADGLSGPLTEHPDPLVEGYPDPLATDHPGPLSEERPGPLSGGYPDDESGPGLPGGRR